MAEYIDRQAVMTELEKEVELADDWNTAHEIANVVKYFPVADVQEVKHGKWVFEDTGRVEKTARCSECCEGGFAASDVKYYRFCPNCGAKMEGRDMNDLISRQAAINLFKKYQPYLAVRVIEFGDALEHLPSAQPEQRWIPVSERLPDKPNIYTVTDSKGDVVRFAFYNNESSREYWKRCAKAWMPLPKPYKEEQDEKN